jgi:hypothetical protein
VVAAYYKKDDLLTCCTINSDISGYQEDTALSEQGRGAAWHVGINGTTWQGNGIGSAWARHVMSESAFSW